MKSLIGWKGGNSPLTENDLEKAKQTLREFHLVFISESMSSSNTTAFLNKIFQPDTWLASEGGGGSHAGAIQMSSLLRASNKGQSNNKKAFPILVEKQVRTFCVVCVVILLTGRRLVIADPLRCIFPVFSRTKLSHA